MEFNESQIRSFRELLLQWYGSNARNLPWRASDNPYHIMVSEIMLQQTRVDQARPYFERFIRAFPTIKDLAEAALDEVLLNWEGLGYYSRARNLKKAAQRIFSEHQGQVPQSYESLLTLPGIGPYTAAAIMSIAYNEPYGVLDGNVIRVLTRLTCNDGVTSSAKTKRILQDQSNVLVDPEHPGSFNQALMELGATCCTPKNPQCASCPVRTHCCANRTEATNNFPVVKKKAPVPHYDIAVGLLKNEQGAFLIQRRAEDQMLGGMWEFPAARVHEGESYESACERFFSDQLGLHIVPIAPFHSLSHAYSHFKITLHSFTCSFIDATPQNINRESQTKWVKLTNLSDFAFHRAHRRLIDYIEKTVKNPTLFG